MNKNKQKGVTLLEMILVVGLIATMTLISFYEKQLEMEQMRAKQVGSELYVFNNAVRKWISNNPQAFPATRNGTTWLRSNACGGASGRVDGYLPCDFPAYSTASPSTFGRLVLTTTITNEVLPGAVNDGAFETPKNKVTATTTSSPFMLPSASGGALRTDLAGLAALAAAGGVVLDSSAPLGASTDSSFRSNATTGRITITTQNAYDLDAWLRTDGGNRMNANIRFNNELGHEDRQIQGVSRLQGFLGDVLYIGNSSTPFGSDTFPSSQGAGQVNSLDMGNGVLARVVIDSNARVYGSLKANNDLIAKRFIDADNSNYFVDPAEVSNLNETRAELYSSAENRPVLIKPNNTHANPLSTNSVQVDARNIQLNAGNSSTSGSTVRMSADGASIVMDRDPSSDTSSGPAVKSRISGDIKLDGSRIYLRRGTRDVPLDELLSNFVFVESWYALNGQTVRKPTCGPGGIPKIIVVPQTIPTNTARPISGYSQAPVGATFFYAVDSSSTLWTVRGEVWSESYGGNASAIATTYCLY